MSDYAAQKTQSKSITQQQFVRFDKKKVKLSHNE